MTLVAFLGMSALTLADTMMIVEDVQVTASPTAQTGWIEVYVHQTGSSPVICDANAKLQLDPTSSGASWIGTGGYAQTVRNPWLFSDQMPGGVKLSNSIISAGVVLDYEEDFPTLVDGAGILRAQFTIAGGITPGTVFNVNLMTTGLVPTGITLANGTPLGISLQNGSITVVPEPSTVSMLLGLTMTLVIMGHRFRRSSSLGA
jgi:hypothetical protein